MSSQRISYQEEFIGENCSVQGISYYDKIRNKAICLVQSVTTVDDVFEILTLFSR